MLIEAYKTNGAIALAREFSLQELRLLINQTAELRRDPEERKKEQERLDAEEASRYLRERKIKDMKFISDRGEVVTLDISAFALSEDES